MKKSLAIVIASLGLTAMAVGGLAACKQGEGDRCQVQSDCEDGLICNQAEQICSATNASGLDATPPPVDGPPGPPDAPPDAPDASPVAPEQ